MDKIRELHMILPIPGRSASIHVDSSEDPYYPGVSLELVISGENPENLSRFRVDMEWPAVAGEPPRVRLWNDPYRDDPSDEIDADEHYFDRVE